MPHALHAAAVEKETNHLKKPVTINIVIYNSLKSIYERAFSAAL